MVKNEIEQNESGHKIGQHASLGKTKVGKIVDWAKMPHWEEMKLGQKIGQKDSLNKVKVGKIVDWAKMKFGGNFGKMIHGAK